MDSFAAIIKLWPSAAELGRSLEPAVDAVTVRAWKKRGIPAQYWAGLVAAAEKDGKEGVTLERFVSLAAASPRKGTLPQSTGATA